MSFQVYLDNVPLQVLHSTIFPAPYNERHSADFVIITGEGSHTLTVAPSFPVKQALVRPLSLNLSPSCVSGLVSVTLDKPVNFSLEFNGDSENTLLVFYSPKRIPSFNPNDPNVLYFPRGTHTPSVIDISADNTLVYIEEGAWVNGKFSVHDCRNFHLCGHGVFTTELYTEAEHLATHNICLDVVNCQNVLIEDVTLADSLKWTCRIFGCDDVHIDNVKIIGCRGNSDGIDVCGSRNVLVEHIFTRTWDDSFVVKAFDSGNLENVVFRNSVLWNDFARPIEVGVELRADSVRNVLFDNIDIIHSPTGYPVMGIHHGDRALVSDITFRNIRIEDTPGAQLFDIRITDSVWNKDTRKGRIENITFENIDLIGQPGLDYLPEKSRLQGFDENCDIRNVLLKNLRYLGRTVTSLKEANLLVMDHVSDVRVESDSSADPIGHVATGIQLSQPLALGEDGLYRGTARLSLLNDGPVSIDCTPRLVISPARTALYHTEPFALSLKPGEGASFEIPLTLPAGRYMLRVQAQEPAVDSFWTMLTLPLCLSKTSVEYSFVNYYDDRLARVRLSAENDLLTLSSDIIAREDAQMTVYSAMPADEFEGEVKFTVEETDFGEAPAVLLGKHGLELAPQLRCPAEITYVFKNEPRVKEIRKTAIPRSKDGVCTLSFDQLGLSAGAKKFWLEIEVELPETKKYRYPYTLFHSVRPNEIAHMFAHVELSD